MSDLQSALLDLDEDVERLSRGVNAVWAVCEAIRPQSERLCQGALGSLGVPG